MRSLVISSIWLGPSNEFQNTAMTPYRHMYSELSSHVTMVPIWTQK